MYDKGKTEAEGMAVNMLVTSHAAILKEIITPRGLKES